MAAQILALPRFDGERPRALPQGEIAFDEALAILAARAAEWRDIIDGQLQNGHYLTSAETGRDHVVVDGKTLQSLGEDLQSLSHHLDRMAAMVRQRDSGE